MSEQPGRTGAQAPTFFTAPGETPSLKLHRASSVSPRSLLVRFAFGAATSAVAGVISVVWNSRVGGIMLAFPAILAASLTLIANEESRRAAREDARGAVVGAIGLASFAVVGYFSFSHLDDVLVLLLALLAWISVSLGLYGALWAPRRGLFSSASRLSAQRPRD